MQYVEMIKNYFLNIDESSKFYWYIAAIITIGILFFIFNACNNRSKSNSKK